MTGHSLTVTNKYEFLRSWTYGRIDPKDGKQYLPFQDFPNEGNLFLGKARRMGFATEYPDSIFVNFNDAFLSMSDIERFCARTAIDSEPGEAMLVLHADKSVPQDFINRVIREVPDSMPVFRAVKKGGELCLVELGTLIK